MTNDNRRITLVARDPRAEPLNWDESNPHSRLIFIDALSFLRFAIDRGVSELNQDVERVIIDRRGTALQFLEALSSLPAEFVGDVLFVMNDGNGFLSSVGRGGDRVLYAVSPQDVGFYLETHGLIWKESSQYRIDVPIQIRRHA
jgi:hypothetical protein